MKKLLYLTLLLSAVSLSAQDTSSAFSDAVDNGDGTYTNWIGTFTPASGTLSTTGFIDHEAHGDLYLSASGQNVFLYDPNVAALTESTNGWIYTSRNLFPYFYVYELDTYLVFVPGAEGPELSPRVFLSTADYSPLFLSDRTINTIVDVAVGSGSFDTLVTAVTTAELASTLATGGPFTVFAPTDDAFGALDTGVLDSLLGQPDVLSNILLYHVVEGTFTAENLGLDANDIFSGESQSYYIETLAGSDLKIDVTPFGILVDGIEVIIPNVEASNGVVHAIGSVLSPPEDIVTTVVNASNLTTLETAVVEAELAATLSGPGPFTVFAPNDDAFAALGSTLNDLLLPENIGQLQDILQYHVISGAVYSSEVPLGEVTMLNGATATIATDSEGNLTINGATIYTTDIKLSNGVVHLIDEVILPPSE